MEKARHDANLYSTDFVNLISILGLDNIIHGIRESSLIDEATFNKKADNILPVMEKYIQSVYFNNQDKGLKELITLGWNGQISQTTLEYYLKQYDKMYSGRDLNFKLHKLARYFTGALARSILKIRGDIAEWNGKFLDLSFIENPPGSDTRFNRRILYRTLPTEFTINHLPAWRSKGYLLIDEDGLATPKLTTFQLAETMELNTHTVELTGEKETVTLTTDYLLK